MAEEQGGREEPVGLGACEGKRGVELALSYSREH